ncbi:MAG TPA: RcnB family protein [Caulobacteraceae bacterium]|nr:RcnB family protein [Caulobacteraceae bacterium]
MSAANAEHRRDQVRPNERPGVALLAVALGLLAASAAPGHPRDPPWDRYDAARGEDGQDLAQLQFEPHGRPRPPSPDVGGRYRPHYGRWWPGQTLPPDAPATVLADPARFHLRPAPPGYTWLLCDGDLMLASSASGLIVEVIPAGVY